VENHGGLSSNGQWLVGVMELVDHPMAGTLPDFGNFRLDGDEWYDRCSSYLHPMIDVTTTGLMKC